MTARRHRHITALRVLATCGFVVAVGAGASSAGAAPERSAATLAGTVPGEPSDDVLLSIPWPTGRHLAGVRSTFVYDPARTEPTTGGPRAIPVRVWYPARHRGSTHRGPSAPYFSSVVQPVIEQGV